MLLNATNIYKLIIYLSYTQSFHVCCKHTDLPMCCTSWLCGQSDLLRSSCLREAREEAPNLQALHCPHRLCHRCHLPQESALCGNVPQILRSSQDLHPQMRRRSKSVAASPSKRHPKTTCLEQFGTRVKLGEHAVAELMCKSNQSNRSSDIRHISYYFVICRHISLYFVISSNVNGLAHQLFQHMLVTPYRVHTGSILGPQFSKKTTHSLPKSMLCWLDLTGSHWISLVPAVSPILCHSLPACNQLS